MGMGMPHLTFLTTKYPERFLHDEKSGKADEHGQASRTSVGHLGLRVIQSFDEPNQDIALFFNHYKMYAWVLMLTHEGMRDEVKKYVR